MALELKTAADGSVATVTITGITETDISPARSIPTLVYNCGYMPFIYKNIANYIATRNNVQFVNGLMKLHLDVNAERTEKRQSGVCRTSVR